MRSMALQVMCALLLLSGNGCNDPAEPGTPVPPDFVSVQAVRVTPQVIQFAAIGETRRLTATVSPANATDQAVTWESTHPGVASVDAAGLVTAKAAGSGVFVTVLTQDGRHEASVNISVNP